MHPDDATAAIDLGYNGILVSNHGGRQLDAAPSSIEVLPEIVDVVGDRATVMVDSGFSNGLDVMKALALGADFVFCGRAFMWGLGAMGPSGPGHVADMLASELELQMIQLGVSDIAELDRSWITGGGREWPNN
jgi:isopentenyl diphosphate isomerase/L-lactate dehydrogenase-like FMN-dependent dehydrogenase